MDCIFCKIARGDIPSNKVYEDEAVLAFHDIAPMAPVHILIIPKEHLACGACEITSENEWILGRIFAAANKIAAELQLEGGFRLVTNNGPDAGQTVPHLHFHLLAGGELGKMA